MWFSESSPHLHEVSMEAESNRCNMVVMPEKWLKDTFELNSTVYAHLMEELKEVSSGFDGIFIPGSFTISEGGNTYNRSFVFRNGEIAGIQDKISLYRLEASKYHSGSNVTVMRTDGLNFGVPVCYDLDFPYFAKILAKGGATFMVNPSLIADRFREMWHIYVRGRSLENRMPVISVNSSDDMFGGNSIITSIHDEGDGVILTHSEAGKEIFFYSEIDLDGLDQLVRRRIEEDPGTYMLEKNSYPGKEV